MSAIQAHDVHSQLIGCATAATGLIAPITRSVNTFATLQLISNAQNAISMDTPGTTCLIIAVTMVAAKSVKGAMMEMERIGIQIQRITGSMWMTATFAKPVSSTSLHQAIYTRYTRHPFPCGYSELIALQHRLSHRAANYECYRCYRKFKTYGGMIIHLERGTCSDIDHTDLNMLAAECRKWQYFIDDCCRDELLDYGELVYYYTEADPYLCPTCDAKFPKLSSLFQHIESSSCEQSLDDNVIGQLRNFLASRLS
ncbi:Nn.00g103450.m01.CDS01 [Neocucurbitaria sp. VM-36]